MPWTSDFRIIRSPRKEVHLLQRDGEDWQAACTKAIDEQIDLARAQNVFRALLERSATNSSPSWAPDILPVWHRSAVSVFGITAAGAHMTVYTHTQGESSSRIPRRNAIKSTWPNLLDQAVAGGIAAGEMPSSASSGRPRKRRLSTSSSCVPTCWRPVPYHGSTSPMRRPAVNSV